MGRPRFSTILRCALIFGALVALQWPFLRADADLGLGWSRGSYTDEGLYTAQVRNALVTGHLDLAESDGVVKEPLYALLAWAWLQVAGDSMATMRAGVMWVCAAALAAMAAGSGGYARLLWLAIPLGFLSYYPLHYGHLALPEIPSCVAIVAALGLVHARLSGGRGWTIVASAGCAFIAYALKFQFVYAAVVVPLAFALAWVGERLRGPVRGGAGRDVFSAALAAVAFAIVFALAWVLPNRTLLHDVLAAQAAQRTTAWPQLPAIVWRNLDKLGADFGVRSIELAAVAVIACALWRLRRRAAVVASVDPALWRRRSAWLAPPLAWVIVESHKLTLAYLPSRYVVSLIVACALLVSAAVLALGAPTSAARVVGQVRGPRGRRDAVVVAMTLAMALALAMNARQYLHARGARQYVIDGAQRQLAADARWRGRMVVGPWAATLFWGTGAVTKPVWAGYFNDTGILARFHPAAIVTELDEDDSDHAFERDHVVLPAVPTASWTVHRWTVELYVLPSGG